MIKEGKIGVQETIFIVVIAICNRIFFTAPAVVVRAVGPSAWYMALISNLVAIVFFTFIFLLLRRFPGKSILEIFPIAFGRVAGYILVFIYAVSFIAAGGILIREFADTVKIYLFQRTPISVLIGTFIIVAVTAAYLGLETISRTAKLAGYALLGGLVLIFILTAQNYRLSNLFPISGYGLGNTVYEGITRSSAYGEIIIVAIFAGALQGNAHVGKIGYVSLAISGIITAAALFFMTLTFPYHSFIEITSPLYEMVRLINYGAFVQRIESLFFFVWAISSLLSGGIIFYSGISSYCRTFAMDDKRPILLPLGILMFTVAMIPSDFISVVENYIQLLRVFPIILFYMIPLAALVLCLIRGKKGEGGEALS